MVSAIQQNLYMLVEPFKGRFNDFVNLMEKMKLGLMVNNLCPLESSYVRSIPGQTPNKSEVIQHFFQLATENELIQGIAHDCQHVVSNVYFVQQTLKNSWLSVFDRYEEFYCGFKEEFVFDELPQVCMNFATDSASSFTAAIYAFKQSLDFNFHRAVLSPRRRYFAEETLRQIDLCSFGEKLPKRNPKANNPK